MKELIDKNDLIKTLEAMIPQTLDGCGIWGPIWQIDVSATKRTIMSVIGTIRTIPSKDIVECRDCKYAQMSYRGDVKYCSIWFPEKPHCMPKDHFCSMGERKKK